jgi:quinol monooxygenase YgiN
VSQTLTVIARLHAKPGQGARLRQELQRLVAPTRAEPGCILYELHESQTAPGLFLFYEVWKSQEDLEAHFETPHIKAIQKVLPDILEVEMDLTKWMKV